jgi:methylmalonyl-CoA mutase cobalamin-binding domain/chain
VWFDAIGVTGNVAALTDKRALSDNVLGVLGAMDEEGKLASEYSLALGSTGDVDALTDPAFLASLKGISEPLRAEVLSGVWYSRSAGWATPGVIRQISSGEIDVWRDIARMPADACAPHVVIVGLNDGHDRGSKYVAQSMKDSGFDVIYVSGDAKSPEEIVKIARIEGASAIGFSLMGDSYQRIVSDVLRQIKVQGISGISIFGGGTICQHASDILQRAGVRMFGQGYAQNDLEKFLTGSTMPRPQQTPSQSGHGLSISVPASAVQGRTHAPVTASISSSGGRRWQEATHTLLIGGQAAFNAYLRSESVFGVPSSDLDDELKRSKKLFEHAALNNTRANGARKTVLEGDMLFSNKAVPGIIVSKTSNSQAVVMKVNHASLYAIRAVLPSGSMRSGRVGSAQQISGCDEAHSPFMFPAIATPSLSAFSMRYSLLGSRIDAWVMAYDGISGSRMPLPALQKPVASRCIAKVPHSISKSIGHGLLLLKKSFRGANARRKAGIAQEGVAKIRAFLPFDTPTKV